MEGQVTAPPLSPAEKEILNAIQEGLPLTRRPFLEVATALGRKEDEVIQVVKALKDKGVIRRIGASFDSHRLGLASTLVAMKVPPQRLEEVAGLVSSYPEVTHNYQRDHHYNLWFALVARDKARIESILDELRHDTGISEMYPLPTLRRFKIRVRFDL
jgi:DNA-binding Lrp family transcriptional regulator